MPGPFRVWTSLAVRRPILTLAVTNGVLGGAGDLLAQSIENRTESTSTPFCWIPGAQSALSPGAPYFPLPALDTSKTLFASAVAKRVAADQLVYAPLGIAGFFIAMNAMEGHGWRSAKHRLGELYRPTLFANYAVWPAVQAINFAFIPTIYRVPFCSAISIFWNAFISWTNAQSPALGAKLPLESPHIRVKPAH
ncbi:hypothetical protein DL89DRAFT_258348 [Linderina pennispora]|uniref:Protein SYM1 n=1 Tax=Linderina pennispora TaxID=61395 RepID=A0A1Y1W7A8_9FUNG|nr:uncharacterized protein DL89DRAFT_258348 [Linderina pennispora]ORX69312.1 hypothetical protein DL89DRAFT_258348 [Linderina pennispora]